jgi:hypothetical protein
LIEALRRWRYKRYESRIASTEDFAQFNQWASGPWTPEIVSRLPWEVLVKGPWNGGIDAETRQVIDLEIEKRFRSIHPMLANLISTAALIVAIIALFRSGN